MRSRRAGLVATALAAASFATAGELVERIVAVVDERPLLLSEVRTLAAVRGLAPEDALRAAIDERLMHAEASRLAQAEVRPEEEDRALAALVAREAAAVAVADADLRRLLRRQITILKYVEFRFRPQVRVDDDAVRAAWEKDAVGRPSGPALEDAQDAIRARLEREALDQRVEAWIAELRARADVRLVPEPAEAP